MVFPVCLEHFQQRRRICKNAGKQAVEILIFYSRVSDAITGRQVGNLLNITAGGAMVLCEKPIDPQIVMELHIELPDGIAEKSELVITATSVWHQPDINPEFYDVGFRFQEVAPEDQKIIQVLVKEYGFRQQ
jgi:hypothetical protein